MAVAVAVTVAATVTVTWSPSPSYVCTRGTSGPARWKGRDWAGSKIYAEVTCRGVGMGSLPGRIIGSAATAC